MTPGVTIDAIGTCVTPKDGRLMLDALNYTSSVVGRSAGGLENDLFGIYLITRGHNHSKNHL